MEFRLPLNLRSSSSLPVSKVTDMGLQLVEAGVLSHMGLRMTLSSEDLGVTD